MRKRTHRKWLLRGLPLLLVAVAFGAGAWALTASNNFDATAQGGNAGSGSGTISGYDIGVPTYTFDATNTNITAFDFSIKDTDSHGTISSGMTVKASVVDGQWADSCAVTATDANNGTVHCVYSTSPPLITAANNLTVVATS